MKFMVMVLRSFIVEAEDAATIEDAVKLEESSENPWNGLGLLGDFPVATTVVCKDQENTRATVEVCEDGTFDRVER